MTEISFVLAIYNAERTLNECLSSILAQNYKDFEIVIVDGGSTDSTLKIIESFTGNTKKIRLFHNPKKLSEGKGMSKDIGEKVSKGKYVIFLDHDNILIGPDWIDNLILPFKNDREIMASQSMLAYNSSDPVFLKYVNSLGVEDPFAIPKSLVSQITLHPEKFKLVQGKYYVHTLDRKNVLYAGANGCAFRKEVFARINGYTRDVDVFSSMADYGMKVAVVKNARVNHKTSGKMLDFMIKKGKYFRGFFKSGYKHRKYRWVEKGINGKLNFALMILSNLSLAASGLAGIKQAIKTHKLFWLLHPFYVFFFTLEYLILGLLNFRSFFLYAA